jgi:uncharacterized membrane-anchored protein
VKLKLLVLVVGLQAAWMVATTVMQEWVLARGRTILLETRPVDPRDMLRGDYVILRYKISDVPLNLFTPPLTNSPTEGSKVYVVLEKRGEFHEIVRVATNTPQANENQVVLRGRVERGWWSTGTNSASVEYGLERFYVSEGTGNPTGKLTVQVAAPSSGNGMIKELFVDGKPFREAMMKGRK